MVWDATWPEKNAEWAGKKAKGSGRRMRAHCTGMKGFWGRQWGGATADGDGRIRIMVKRFHLQLGALNQCPMLLAWSRRYRRTKLSLAPGTYSAVKQTGNGPEMAA